MTREEKRVLRQAQLEVGRTRADKNKCGQTATPPALARAITRDLLNRIPSESPHVLEPACGTGAFISALFDCCPKSEIYAVEADSEYAAAAASLWSNARCTIEAADFFDTVLDHLGEFDGLVSNPPYTRHHHISADKKTQYRQLAMSLSGHKLSSLAGLHAYFIMAGMSCLKPGGVASWLIPSELLSVNYGKSLREFIASSVTLERVHIFDAGEVLFEDVLVSSSVLVICNQAPNPSHAVQITFGDFESPQDTISMPLRELASLDKWQHMAVYSRHNKPGPSKVPLVGEYFSVKRGVATGANSFFIRALDEWKERGIDERWLRPVLPSSRVLHTDVVSEEMIPSLPHILDIPRSMRLEDMPARLRELVEDAEGMATSGYILKHRTPWYSVGKLPSPPIVCTYMGRSNDRPFRFIRNIASAVITNVYLGLWPLHPMCSDELDTYWKELNLIDPQVLIIAGREYGGGLKKLEPKELSQVRLSRLVSSASDAG